MTGKKIAKRARVLVGRLLAGHLIEYEQGKKYEFRYLNGYRGPQISLTMPTTQQVYSFDEFPPFFEGFLPEGIMFEFLLKKTKLDASDRFEQLVLLGKNLVGNLRVERES